MYTRENAREQQIMLLILLLASTGFAADGRQYKAKERQGTDSEEQSSDEGQVPFSAEFGDFFPDGSPKESSESFGFSEDFNPDFIPYSESRNATKYVNPAETYHVVRDMPGHGRDHPSSYKEDHGRNGKYDPSYKKEHRRDYRKHNSRHKEDPYYKDDNYQKEDAYSKEDGYNKNDSYRKSDSYRKDETYSSKDEPSYRSRDSSRRSKNGPHSYSRRQDSYARDDEPPYYRSRSDPRYRKESTTRSPHRSDTLSPSHRSSRRDSEEGSDKDYSNSKKKPIQKLYDDWSPEDDKPSYSESDRSEPDGESDYDESDYRDRDDSPPPPPPPSSSRYIEKGAKKSLPTSMRPGPPYYSPTVRRPEPRTHTTTFGVRHELPPPTPQTYYSHSSSPRKYESTSRDFHHRKGEPAPTKSHREWSEFRPSPPDPLQNSRARSRSDDYSHSEYSSPIAKKEKISTTTPRPQNRQNCVKMKKTSSPEPGNGKYVKKMTTCYVCVDEKTGTNYEECSYETDSKTKPYVKTTGEEQSRRSDVSHRDRRDVSKLMLMDVLKPTASTDRAKREKEYYEGSKEEGDGYKYSSESFDSGEREKDESSDESKDSNSDKCYTKKKGEMSCVVCETPNKKGSYEQCSYASEPNKNKYEHSVEKVYGSPRLPQSATKYNKKGYGSKDDDYDSSVELPSKSDYASPPEFDSDILGKGKDKAERKQFGGGSDSFNFGSFDGFGSLFGDLSGEAFDFDSIPEPAENEGQFSTKDEIFNFKPEEIGDIDMTKNIDDFGLKNRSHCKKVMKNKMTCYQCVTSKGTKNEECMYVAAAEPKSKHLSFSQVHEYRFDPDNTTTGPSIAYPTFTIEKRKHKKYHPDLMDMKFFSKLKEKSPAQASRWPRSPEPPKNNTTEVYEGMSTHNVTSRDDQVGSATETNAGHSESENDEEDEEEEDTEGEEEESEEEQDETDHPHEEYNAVPTDPPEIDLKEAEKGEFHTDTEPAWDPKLGISLPRYMLERSEHEAIFDEVLASG